MAQGVTFSCNRCGHSIEAWNDGNPYYVDERGKKRYAYHPSSERDLCVGNDSPHICLSCGRKFMVDSRKPISACPSCKEADIVDTYNLNGRKCPYCKNGNFPESPMMTGIS
jgi:predicted RNA-binding Zn-ribbon protein involved in translation (DUF1610 family)